MGGKSRIHENPIQTVKYSCPFHYSNFALNDHCSSDNQYILKHECKTLVNCEVNNRYSSSNFDLSGFTRRHYGFYSVCYE